MANFATTNLPSYFAETNNSVSSSLGVIVAAFAQFLIHGVFMLIIEFAPNLNSEVENQVEIKKMFPVTFLTYAYCFFTSSTVGVLGCWISLIPWTYIHIAMIMSEFEAKKHFRIAVVFINVFNMYWWFGLILTSCFEFGS